MVDPITMFGGIGGGLVSGFAGPLLVRAINRPRLELTLGTIDRIPITPPAGPAIHQAWVRVAVRNKKLGLAKNCRAYLAGIEVRNQYGGWDATTYADSIQLRWACTLPADEFRPVDIPKGPTHNVDIFATDSRGNVLKPQVYFWPTRDAQIFRGPGEWKISAYVAGDDVPPAMIEFALAWDGTWNGVTTRTRF